MSEWTHRNDPSNGGTLQRKIDLSQSARRGIRDDRIVTYHTAPSHTSLPAAEILAKFNMAILLQVSHSSDPAPSDKICMRAKNVKIFYLSEIYMFG